MAKKVSAQRALLLVLEKREALYEDVKEEVSECDSHISEKPDSNLEEEDEMMTCR